MYICDIKELNPTNRVELFIIINDMKIPYIMESNNLKLPLLPDKIKIFFEFWEIFPEKV